MLAREARSPCAASSVVSLAAWPGSLACGRRHGQPLSNLPPAAGAWRAVLSSVASREQGGGDGGGPPRPRCRVMSALPCGAGRCWPLSGPGASSCPSASVSWAGSVPQKSAWVGEVRCAHVAVAQVGPGHRVGRPPSCSWTAPGPRSHAHSGAPGKPLDSSVAAAAAGFRAPTRLSVPAGNPASRMPALERWWGRVCWHFLRGLYICIRETVWLTLYMIIS